MSRIATRFIVLVSAMVLVLLGIGAAILIKVANDAQLRQVHVFVDQMKS